MIVRPFKSIFNCPIKLVKANLCTERKLINELKCTSVPLNDLTLKIAELGNHDNVNINDVTELFDRIESTSRFDELLASPYHAVSIIRSAITLEVYPEKLINSVLQDDFIINFPEDRWQLKAFLTIRDALAIECYPKYSEKIEKFDQLMKSKKPFERWSMKELLPMNPKNQTFTQKLTVLLYLACKEYYPKQTIARNILSFCVSPDVIICDSRFSPLLKDEPIEFAPNVVRGATVIRRFKEKSQNIEFIGDFKLRNRLLEKMGFKTFITIPLTLDKKRVFSYFRSKIPVKVDG